METKHTPGPWTVTGQSEAGRYISVTAPHAKKLGRKTICRVPFSNENGPITDDADARLIAAAPDMLAALKRVTEQLAHEHYSDEAWVQARAAIAKAEGR